MKEPLIQSYGWRTRKIPNGDKAEMSPFEGGLYPKNSPLEGGKGGCRFFKPNDFLTIPYLAG
ncbi:hypothetical protein DAMNIGENAA_39150 [Desulforhabdus amnigena]|uniref:Uncharacterized protein n=1 Tax=Desulforhabdus amnigena TaxID=40218 RepID=A0A9W6FX86_9BACT|nr:hypothetical protein DAMNIGENAA_39150 [Desulforhabdus amnigena]